MAADHRAIIERIRASADEVQRAVEAVTPGQQAVSPREGEWSVLETLVHLRNVVVMVHGLRIRRLLYEDNPTFADYDEPACRRVTMDRGPAADQLVGMIVAEYQQIAGLLSEVPDDQWSRAGRHADLGEMSVEFLAGRVAEHADERARQIRETATDADQIGATRKATWHCQGRERRPAPILSRTARGRWRGTGG